MRWCQHCKTEHPETEAFYKRQKTGKLSKGCHAYRRHRAGLVRAFRERRGMLGPRTAAMVMDPLTRLAQSGRWV